jgi:acyl carrier protein
MSIDASGEAALRIARFIVTQLDYQGPATDLIGSQPVRLIEAVDSAALLALVAFVEDAFGIQIQDVEFVPENFATVADLVRLLRGKGALGASSATDDKDGKRSPS